MKKNEMLVHIPKLTIKEGRTLHIINYADIRWFKAEGNYTTLFLADQKKIVSRISLSELEQQLPREHFIRIHKSYIINIQLVNQIRANRILINEEELPIGRHYQQTVMAFF